MKKFLLARMKHYFHIAG